MALLRQLFVFLPTIAPENISARSAVQLWCAFMDLWSKTVGHVCCCGGNNKKTAHPDSHWQPNMKRGKL
jgi:hypothetical protein